MKTHVAVLASLLTSLNLQGYSNFVDNPDTPYPPGCTALPDLQTALHGKNAVKFYEARLSLQTSYKPADAIVAAYRLACAEKDRSIILFEFSAPDGASLANVYKVPDVWLSGGVGYIGMRLVPEANSWGLGIEPWYYPQEFGGYDSAWVSYLDLKWIYVLTNDGPFAPNIGWHGSGLSAADYNSHFTLVLNAEQFPGDYYISVPATAGVLDPNPSIPLSGRLSGNWVIDGVPDQGFVISVSEMAEHRPAAAGDDSSEPYESTVPLLMFLSWYTFDSNGSLLWLTGTAQFAAGATQVTIPIERVTNGRFFGNQTADREVVGSVVITGNNCNDLGLDYTLSNIGLGAGTRHLKRLFSLETAGYTCRDLEARLEEEGK